MGEESAPSKATRASRSSRRRRAATSSAGVGWGSLVIAVASGDRRAGVAVAAMVDPSRRRRGWRCGGAGGVAPSRLPGGATPTGPTTVRHARVSIRNSAAASALDGGDGAGGLGRTFGGLAPDPLFESRRAGQGRRPASRAASAAARATSSRSLAKARSRAWRATFGILSRRGSQSNARRRSTTASRRRSRRGPPAAATTPATAALFGPKSPAARRAATRRRRRRRSQRWTAKSATKSRPQERQGGRRRGGGAVVGHRDCDRPRRRAPAARRPRSANRGPQPGGGSFAILTAAFHHPREPR